MLTDPVNLMRWLPFPAVAAAVMLTSAASASSGIQNPIDRADPGVVERELGDPRRDDEQRERPRPQLKSDEAPRPAAVMGSVEATAISIEGATALRPEAFEAATRPFIGRPLDAADLRALAGSIADVARGAGYGLATAWIPQQVVERGVLRVQIEEGRIDGIEISGSAAALVKPVLEPLATGTPIKTAELERRLLLASDLYGVWVGKARLRRVNRQNILVVDTHREPATGRVSLDNWGSATVGPVRLNLGADLHGLLSAEDRLSIGGVITPLEPREYALVRGKYIKGLGANGTEISVGGYAARSRAGGALRDLAFEGESGEGAVAVSQALLRSRAASLWADLELTVRDAEQSRRGIEIRDDRLSVLRASTYLSAKVGGGRARARLALAQGLDIFDATEAVDPLRSRFDGSGIFSKAEFWAHYDRTLGGSLSLQLEAEGQIASRPLLSSEEMGLGGRYFLRGYDYREFAGDKGIAGSVELRFDLRIGGPVKAAQLYGYADAGAVGNLGQGRGGGSLASAGGGIRALLEPRLEGSLEVGVPLRKGFDEDWDLDPRVSFVLTSRF